MLVVIGLCIIRPTLLNTCRRDQTCSCVVAPPTHTYDAPHLTKLNMDSAILDDHDGFPLLSSFRLAKHSRSGL